MMRITLFWLTVADQFAKRGIDCAEVITEPLPDEPTLEELARPRMWLLEEPRTLTARHRANMQLKSLIVCRQIRGLILLPRPS